VRAADVILEAEKVMKNAKKASRGDARRSALCGAKGTKVF
jgi:hypothetical protein